MKVILWILFVILAGLYITGPVMDPDLWWHIVVGRWILAHHQVPVVDHWNMFGVGLPWTAYSWSNEIIYALVDKWWALNGLLVLQGLLAVAISVSFSWSFGILAGDYFIGGLLGIVTTASVFNHFTLRPQSFTWALLAWLLVVADSVYRKGITPKKAVLIFLLIALWANSHITASLGLIIALLWSLDSARNGFNVKTLGFTALAGLLALFCTPYVGAELFALTSQASHPFAYGTISEFQAAAITHYSTAFLIITLAIVCLFIHERPKAMPLSRILAICLVTLMGMAVVKFLPLAVIVLSAALASFWLEFGKDSKKLGRLGEALTALKKLYEDTLVGHGLAVFLIAALFIQIVRIDSHRTSAQQTPKEAVDYIINNNLPGPILNIFGDGGYLMYRYSDELGEPKLLVPIDGRTNVNDREVMRKHEKAIAGKLGWREYIEAVNPNVILWRTEGPLTAILLEKPEWKLVHQDGTDDSGHVVFVKTKLAR